MKAFTPADIRKALGKKDKTSAPGYDDIIYEYLLNMPYVHKVLATMFTRRPRHCPRYMGRKQGQTYT